MTDSHLPSRKGGVMARFSSRQGWTSELPKREILEATSLHDAEAKAHVDSGRSRRPSRGWAGDGFQPSPGRTSRSGPETHTNH